MAAEQGFCVSKDQFLTIYQQEDVTKILAGSQPQPHPSYTADLRRESIQPHYLYLVVRLQGEFNDIAEAFKETLASEYSLVFCELDLMSTDSQLEIF